MSVGPLFSRHAHSSITIFVSFLYLLLPVVYQYFPFVSFVYSFYVYANRFTDPGICIRGVKENYGISIRAYGYTAVVGFLNHPYILYQLC